MTNTNGQPPTLKSFGEVLADVFDPDGSKRRLQRRRARMTRIVEIVTLIAFIAIILAVAALIVTGAIAVLVAFWRYIA